MILNFTDFLWEPSRAFFEPSRTFSNFLASLLESSRTFSNLLELSRTYLIYVLGLICLISRRISQKTMSHGDALLSCSKCIPTDTLACSKCIASQKSSHHEAWFSGQDALDRGDHHCQACFGQGSSNRFIEKELVLTKAGKGMRKGSDKSSGSGKSNDGKGLDKSSGKSDSGKGFHWRDDRAPQELRQVGLRQGLPLTLAGRTPTRFPASWPLTWAYVDSDQSDDVSCQSPAGGSRHVQSDDGTDSSSHDSPGVQSDNSSYDSTDTSSTDRSRTPQRLTQT